MFSNVLDESSILGNAFAVALIVLRELAGEPVQLRDLQRHEVADEDLFLVFVPPHKCDVFTYERVLAHQRVDLPELDPEAGEVRERMIRETMERLRMDHDCQHTTWKYQRGSGRCESCFVDLPNYIHVSPFYDFAWFTRPNGF
jgi:hypothetical protein